MHYVSLYTPMDIKLDDLAVSAMHSGFKTYYISKTRIGIEFSLEANGEKRVGTWQIWKSDLLTLSQVEPSLLAGREPELLQILQPACVYTVAYRAYSLPKMMLLMKGFLNTFGGWMVSHDTFEYMTEAELDAFMKV
jgi:hypothetical protein